MFAHIFVYRLKTLLRDRSNVFWTAIYPIILAFFYALAFTNINNADGFEAFPVGVVDNAEYRSQAYFIQALDTVSQEGDDKLFDVTLMTLEEAKDSLNNNKIAGYIHFDGGARVVVKSSGLKQTILKGFMDSYLQQSSAVMWILNDNPAAAGGLVLPDRGDYIRPAELAGGKTNVTVIMYYGLIAMAVMFGGFWGQREVEDIQADLSARAARINLSPVHKLKAFVCSLCAALLIQIVSLLVLVLFLTLVLGVDFGPNFGYVALTCVASGVMGVTFGALLAALVKGSAGLRLAVMLTVSLLSSALAGMMFPTIKYIVVEAVPALSYINPANLVSDALYALYYYGPGPRFALNLALMMAFSVVFSLAVYIVMRRQKYASL
jgi:ABC-2 type transport system permease protein